MKLSIQYTVLDALAFSPSWQLPGGTFLDGLSLSCLRKADMAALGNLGHANLIRDVASRHDIGIVGLDIGYLAHEPFVSGGQRQRDEAKQNVRIAIEIAKHIAASVVVVPLGSDNELRSVQCREVLVAGLQELADEAHNTGVTLAVRGRLSCTTVCELLASVDRPQVKFCFDTGTAAVARHDAIGTIRSLGADRIAAVYFRDVTLATHPPDFSVRLGRGDVRFDAVLFALRSIMYDGWVVLEMPPGDPDGQIAALHVNDARSILRRERDTESLHRPAKPAAS